GPPRDACADEGRIGHLRHPFRADEGRHLDHRVAGLGQPVHKRDLVVRRNERRFILEAVAGAHFDDAHARRQGAHSRSTSGTPGWTRSPGLHATDRTRPSRGAVIGSSIFIASSMIRTSPRTTVWPGATFTLATVAGIGEARAISS